MAHTAANTYKDNVITIEVFNADLDISNLVNGRPHSPVWVKLITFVSAAAGDDFALQDDFGVTAKVFVHLAQNINGGMVVADYGARGHIFSSLVFDTSEINAGLGAGDDVQIYLM
jgi:hypothetical protein